MHDLVIRNAMLVDGTGAPKRMSDVAIDGKTCLLIDRPVKTIALAAPGAQQVALTVKLQNRWRRAAALRARRA